VRLLFVHARDELNRHIREHGCEMVNEAPAAG
jgi:hypothetical protein